MHAQLIACSLLFKVKDGKNMFLIEALFKVLSNNYFGTSLRLI